MTAGPCARHLPPWLASRIVTEFSHPGDIIVVPDSGDAALLTAAARHERQTIGYTLSRAHAQRIRHTLAAELRPAQRRLIDVREGWPPAHPRASRHTSRARLLIGLTPCQTRHPGCDGPAVFTTRVTRLCHAASHLLADGGTLIVVTTASPPVMTASDPVTSAANTAETAGFALRQLVAALNLVPAAARMRATRRSSRAAAGGAEPGTHREQPGSQFHLLVLGRAHARRSSQRGPGGSGNPAAAPCPRQWETVVVNVSRHRPAGSARLRIVPVTYRQACDFVAAHHRHHRPPQGHKFSIGVTAPGGCLSGVAIVGRPVARNPGDGYTAEVTRLATDGTPNACSALLRAAWRTARSAGYTRLVTCTQAGESGASLRGAGMRQAAELAPSPGWHRRSRPRQPTGTEHTARIRWEITACGGRRAR